MAIHFRPAPLLATLGVLVLGGASAARAQDTSAASRSDTSGYQAYQNRSDSSRTDSTPARPDTTHSDSSGFKYTGPSTDTTLKAQPGVQTGPSSRDSGRAGNDSGSAGASSGVSAAGVSAADTVVCKDGSNAANMAGIGCRTHGGVDTVATTAALKARGWQGTSDSGMTQDAGTTKDSSAARDTSSSNR